MIQIVYSDEMLTADNLKVLHEHWQAGYGKAIGFRTGAVSIHPPNAKRFKSLQENRRRIVKPETK